MKKCFLSLLLLVIANVVILAQSPQSFSYQAIVRDNLGDIIVNQNVSFRISIQQSAAFTDVYVETQSATTNDFGLANLEIGTGTVVSGDFASIDWGSDISYIQVELDPTGGTAYQLMGVSQLLSVPYSLYSERAGITDSSIWEKNANDIYYNIGNVGVGTISPNGKLQVSSDTTAAINDVIFSVLNAQNDTVFAVYQEGVRIWVSDDTTGAKANGSRGGFAVGGFNPTKSFTNEYFRVSPDSIRVYIKEATTAPTSGSRGGFAVGGYNPTKTQSDYYFNIEHNNFPELVDSKARILWYPFREAFRAGRVLISDVDSVGINSIATGFESKAIGDYSQAFGYRARAFGDNSTAIGISANSTGESSYAFGSGTQAIGLGSFAFGYVAIDTISGLPINGEPTEALGQYSFAFGLGAKAYNTGAFAFGNNTTASGEYSNSFGTGTTASGPYSTAMGFHTTASGTYSLATGSRTTSSGEATTSMGYWSTASGRYATAIGAWHLASGDYSTALGYMIGVQGEFSFGIGLNSAYYAINQDNTMAIMGGNVGIGTVTPSYLLEVNGTAAKPGGGTWTNSSDKRLKDIHGKYEKGLDEIVKLETIKFNYKKNNSRKLPSDINYVGFIAQDVQKVFPEAVSKGSDGYLDFNMHSINVSMINAIQEQQNIISRLESNIQEKELEINSLKEKNIDFEERIEKIEMMLESTAKK